MEDQTQTTEPIEQTTGNDELDMESLLVPDGAEPEIEDDAEITLDSEGNEIATEAPVVTAPPPLTEPTEVLPVEPEVPVFTPEQQAVIDKIVNKVTARERAKAEQQLATYNQQVAAAQQQILEQQQLAAQNADAQKEWLNYGNKVYQDRFAYHARILTTAGWDEAEAKREADALAKKDAVKDVATAYQMAQDRQRLEALQQAETNRQQQAAQAQAVQQKTGAYMQRRAQWLAHDPSLNAFVGQIDAAAKNGLVADFDTAKRYIQGLMLEKGGLESIKTNAQQQALANTKRQKMAVLPGGSSGKMPSQVKVTAAELKMGMALGLTKKDIVQAKLGK